ncbi:MAG: hypothetical protein EA397_17235 [Deltaproteobacteria bacterium]|nr:MAG: hypothetical protein EA397_17235 [Deltaproteobacteria bacterium]
MVPPLVHPPTAASIASLTATPDLSSSDPLHLLLGIALLLVLAVLWGGWALFSARILRVGPCGVELQGLLFRRRFPESTSCRALKPTHGGGKLRTEIRGDAPSVCEEQKR